MKNVLFVLTLLFAGLSLSAQNSRVDNNVNTHCYHDNDTLTNAATVTQTYSQALTYPYNFQINVVSDSLSGSTAGTMTIYNKAYGQTEWVPVGSTVTINGGLTYTAITGNVLSGSLKAVTVGTGTQSTRVAVDICTVRKSQ
jgi:hypothetical protein